MVGVDPEVESSMLRLWIAAGSAAALVALCAIGFARLRTNAVGAATRAGVIALGALLGGGVVWALLSHPAARDRDADRRTLEIRAQELNERALAPGSPLACLDALAGESVVAACEKALFTSAATVAAATSYAAARLELLSDMVVYARHGGTDINGILLPLRRSLEIDSFGFLAHALAIRDGCTSQDCKALDVLRDSSRVRANLSGQAFDRYLDRYLTAWAQPPDVPVADASTQNQPTATSQSGAPGQRKVVVNIDFPTAASIPPVSIMNAEPTGKVLPGVAAAAAANPNPPAATAASAPSKRSRKQAGNPHAQAAAPATAAAPVPADAQADPVWTPVPPAPPTPPAQAAATANAPAANFATGGAAAVQINPFASPQ